MRDSVRGSGPGNRQECAGLRGWLVGSGNDGSVDDDDNGITGLMVVVDLIG